MKTLLFSLSCGALCALGGAYQESTAARAAAPYAWPEQHRAALSLTFDDARPSQLDQGVPLFDRHGIRVTFYVSPGRMEERLDDWRTAFRAGHEIGNHSLTHPCTGNYPFAQAKAIEDMTLTEWVADVEGAQRRIRQHLGVEPTTFAYPCGQTFIGHGSGLRSTVPLVAERFLAGRGWLGEAANDPARCDPALLLAMESDGKAFEELRVLLDDAIARGAWLILAGHEIGEDGRQTTSRAALDALLTYALEPGRGVWVAPVAQVAQRLSERPARPTLDELDPESEIRIGALLSRMTLEEKIGQINMPCVYEDALGRTRAEKMEGCRQFAAGTLRRGVGPGGGFFTLPNTILHEGPRQQVLFLNELQRIAREDTRLGIPLLQTEEGTHGLMCAGGTIFPEGPALGSLWNLDLLRQVYEATAREGRAVGIHQLFTLVVEPIRDPRLGRNIEAYSEDPWLCARMAEVVVRAVQGTNVAAADKTVAGLCHYPGQSQPVGGLERGAMEVSERMLRAVFLPPWEAGIRNAGALGVMATYPAIDGVPAHGSSRLLSEVLRGELGFAGLVLSEGGGLSTLEYEGLAGSPREAGSLALRAGVDVGISYEEAYLDGLGEAVREGFVPMGLVDRAVRRVLRQKMRLGLFENPWADPDRAEAVVHCAEHRQLALQSAREGIVLLKNDRALLPLPRDARRIAVIGPNADNARNQLGDYTSIRVLQEVVTVLQGIRNLAGPGTEVVYAQGCEVLGGGTNRIAEAVQAARDAEVAILVLGENEWRAVDADGRRAGTSGEGFDVATLGLTGRQEELVLAVLATGTPTVAVLINGRPLAIPLLAERVPAVVEAWCPGELGGQAVAEVLFGQVNPSGRLPVTFPRHVGQLPVTYNGPKSKRYWVEHGWGTPYADLDPSPLYPFGHGLGYTTFAYSNLQCSATEATPADTLRVSVDIENTGPRAGQEVVQLYVEDLQASVATPVLELRGFAKVALQPGERQTVELRLPVSSLALYNRYLDRVVEPGEFSIRVGRSAADLPLQTTVMVKPSR